MDPRNNDVCLGLYEDMVGFFYVMKNLMGHVLWERLQKEEGDEFPAQCWKDNHDETNKLNVKVDAMMLVLGIHV